MRGLGLGGNMMGRVVVAVPRPASLALGRILGATLVPPSGIAAADCLDAKELKEAFELLPADFAAATTRSDSKSGAGIESRESAGMF